ncbi:hypothetical protein H9Q10_05595 [Eikenella sp. S3360]|uniref:Uncharacterized protein n=1 Tax=Eikenella glucosivorans TaxID=2766967 RepID=A0ABS0NA39_9NEIS|nr:hypothetical protein [Eikenella glucosivorans]MBH5329140.1 hypothetical protein [Eikenella glucosivorans]
MIEAMAAIAKFLWYLAGIISSLLVLIGALALTCVWVMAVVNRYDDIFIDREQP